MQKLIKLNDQHYIIVNDSEIKEGDWYIDDTNTVRQSITSDKDYWSVRQDYKKITHSTQPLEGVKHIPLSEVEEVIFGYSVQKLSYEKYNDGSISTNTRNDWRECWKEGFKAHQELVKDKLFTEEDMRKAMWEVDRLKTTNLTTENFSKLVDKYIQSLLPKTEWDIEFDEQGKISLAL